MQVELLQGTLDMLILRTLQWGPQHGHGIGQAIRHSSADLLKIERGSLYPAMHRLERQGLIASEWKASEMNRRAKYYRLTAAGRKHPHRRAVEVEAAREDDRTGDAAGVRHVPPAKVARRATCGTSGSGNSGNAI